MKKIKTDELFINGVIYTMVSEKEKYEAAAVDKGIILELGSTSELMQKYAADTLIDLDGKTMIPGMGDSHMHFYAYCQSLTTVDLGNATSKQQAMDMLREKAEETPAGDWIYGTNFDQSKWSDSQDLLPTKCDLDNVSKNHPIIIKRVCLHTAVVNSLALEKAGIGKGFCYGEGGCAEVDREGIPNGIIRERATGIFDDLVPKPMNDEAFRMKTMADALKKASSLGLTRIHTYAAEIWKYSENADDYRKLDAEGLLPLRVTICLDQLFEPELLTEEQRHNPYRKIQMGAYKLFSDGSLGSRSAALFEPYDDDPGNIGIMVETKEELCLNVYEAYIRGLQPAIHCIGDRGLDQVLCAIEYTLDRCKKEKRYTQEEISKRPPFRIIHAQMTNDELTERMCKLPAILDVQPVFLFSDIFWIEERIGKERAAKSYTWKTFKEKGLMCLGGSDSPVETFSPLLGVYAAVNRRNLEGEPKEGFHMEEALSVYDALCMYTKNVSKANCEEDILGTIEGGKIADMVVLDKDIFNVQSSEIKDIKVLKTYLAGQEVFSGEE